ncbi:MAG: hypothetical protein GY765_27335 [bacterium]|nr:hypothetical protein [bacterium]
MKKMQGQNQGPGDLNLALMSYAYTFSNSEIRTIYDYINELSHRSAGIFYTLKQMSKQQFRRKKKTIETQRAEELIIKNGNIFLILMRNLVNCFLEGTPGECGQYVAAALEEIDHLVAECKETIEKGIIISEKVELLKKINLYFEQKPNSRPFASGGNGPGVAG